MKKLVIQKHVKNIFHYSIRHNSEMLPTLQLLLNGKLPCLLTVICLGAATFICPHIALAASLTTMPLISRV